MWKRRLKGNSGLMPLGEFTNRHSLIHSYIHILVHMYALITVFTLYNIYIRFYLCCLLMTNRNVASRLSELGETAMSLSTSTDMSDVDMASIAEVELRNSFSVQGTTKRTSGGVKKVVSIGKGIFSELNPFEDFKRFTRSVQEVG